MHNVLLAAGLFVLGALAFKVLGPSLKGPLDAWVLVRILALLFLANGLYGLVSGRVYGRSWKQYWGGWCYRAEEPYAYWSHAVGHLVLGAFLLWVSANAVTG